MKALYAKGIVHRDLKPQNILLSHSSDKPYPQPTDIKLKIGEFYLFIRIVYVMSHYGYLVYFAFEWNVAIVTVSKKIYV